MKLSKLNSNNNLSKMLLKNHFSGFNFCQKIIKVSIPRPLDSSELDVKNFPTETTTTGEELIKFFKTLTLWRRVEIESNELYKNKEIRGFCHLYIGQEAIALGMHEGLTLEDLLITAYREHCQAMSRGETPKTIIAEMMSRSTGATKGKGGSMHYYNKKHNFYGGHGIVGAQIPLGTGLAFALKYKGNTTNACFTMYGDGSTNQGQLLESSNMAGLWKLPICYVIENNRYAMGTSIERHNHHFPIMSKFRSYPGIKIDGQCVFNVREWTKYCKQQVIKNGPMFLEFDTYRYQGHSMSDPGISYRKREEIENFRKERDCITKIIGLIVENKVATVDQLKEYENAIKDELEKVVEECKKDPYPESKELFTELYSDQEHMFIRGCDLESSLHLNLFEKNNFV